MIEVKDFLSRFDSVKSSGGNKYQAICPCHNDHEASLTITISSKKILLHCHAGCETKDIVNAIGVDYKDLFDNISNYSSRDSWITYVENVVNKKSKIGNFRFIKRYDYYNVKGNYAFSNLRFEAYKDNKRIDKTMRQGIFDFNTNKFTFGFKGQTKKSFKAMYGNLKDIDNHSDIFIVEGEKDVDTLSDFGLYALTVGSSDDWDKDFSQFFVNKNIVAIADNDKSGIAFIDNIIADCEQNCKSIKKIIPSKIQKGDVTDYLTTENHTIEDLYNLIKNAPDLKKSGSATDINNINDTEPDTNTVDTNTATNNEVIDNTRNLDQFHLFYEGGKIKCVFDKAIVKYIIANYNLFIINDDIYIYKHGVYVRDHKGIEVKDIIQSCIYDEFYRSTTVNRIYNALLQQKIINLDPVDLDKTLNHHDKHIINFKNGMYNAKTGELLEHSPEYYSINQIPHNYIPDVPKSVHIENYLNSIVPDEEDREMLLEYIGYCMTIDVSQQVMLFITGIGGTGKSTLLNLIGYIVGKANISNIALENLNDRFTAVHLMDKLLNTSGDLKTKILEDVSMFKKVVGEDDVKGERKGQDEFYFRPYAKLLFSVNGIPKIMGEEAGAVYRRMLAIKMNNKPKTPIPDYLDILKKDINYLIFISLQALKRMYEHGTMHKSRNSEKIIGMVQADSDSVQAFINECCITNKDYKIEKTSLHANYLQFCKEYERTPLAKSNFYTSIKNKGFKECAVHGKDHFRGLDLEKNCSKEVVDIENCKQETLPFNQ